MKEEKKNTNKTTDTEPPLKKKKQSIACDNCRKTKQRCDGNSPCIRCQNKNKTCAYSPTSLRGKRKFSDLDIVKIENNSIINSNYNIMTSSIERKYLDAYFSYMKPPMLFHGINYDNLLNLQGNDGKSLQFNIAIATAARSFGDNAVSTNFEKKARQLAAELFDQFTLDTARGFSMLSYHYSGQDNYLSQHYRDLTISICKRLQAMYSSSSDTSIKSEIFMTKFSACSLSMYDSNAISPFTQLNEEQGLVDIGQLSYLLRKIPRVYDIINKCYNPNNFPCIRKGSLTPEEAEFYLDRLNENFSDHCILRELPEPAKFCCSHILVLKGLVCFCSGQLDKSVEYVTEVVTFFADQKDFVRFCPPFFIHTFHILFSLCYQLGKYELANIVTSLQRYISEILPLGKPLLEANIETLNSMHTINSMNQAFPVQIPQNTTNIIADVSQFNFFEEFLNDNGELSFSSDSQGDDFETSFQSILLDSNFKTSGFDHPQFKSSNSTFDKTVQYDPTFKPNSTESISQIVGYDTPLKSSYDNFEPLTKSGNSKLFHPNTDFNLVKPVEFDFFNSSPSLY